MKIAGAVLDAAGQGMRIEPLILADPGDDEVIVRITSCGICHTDIGVQSHLALPAVLGHEGAGVVERCGSAVTHVSPGDRVLLTFGSCGECRNCRADAPSHCYTAMDVNFFSARTGGRTTLLRENGSPVNGSFFQQSSFASHALATARNVVPVGNEVDTDMLGPLGCGVQTGAGAVENVFLAQAGSTIVCTGLGAVGMSAVMMARHLGCSIIVGTDPNKQRRELASQLGATHVFDAGEGCVEDILALTQGGADYCLDSAGTVETFHNALKSVRCGGHVGVAAVPGWVDGFQFKPSDLAMGRTITGVLEGSSRPLRYIPRLVKLVEQGELPIDRLIQFYPFQKIDEALADLDAGRVIKPVLRMPAS
ncbi:MAG: NAD(P)-dependent alcohol dehydrogenase [Gammaproteobacteria bacterium]